MPHAQVVDRALLVVLGCAGRFSVAFQFTNLFEKYGRTHMSHISRTNISPNIVSLQDLLESIQTVHFVTFGELRTIEY